MLSLRGGRRVAAGLAIAALGTAPAAAAQVRVVAGGQVLRARAADSVPLPGVRVVLHRVGRAEQGPVDSTLADGRGRFLFRFTADTTAIYLLSARHDGIAYFASPVHTNPERPDTAIELIVSDTSSRGRVAMTARHIVISAPDEHDARAVVEVIILHNGGATALTAGDSTRPTWAVRVPRAATGVTAGEGDFSAAAVRPVSDSVGIFAPIAPGDKQLVLQYALPGDIGRVAFGFDEPVPLVNLMLEEKAARVTGGLVAKPDSETIQGRGFQRWEGAVRPGAVITVRLPHPLRLGGWALAALVGALAAGLAGVSWRVLRPPTRPAPVESVATLVDALARLDTAHAARALPPGAPEHAAHEAERAALKARLTKLLAPRGDVP